MKRVCQRQSTESRYMTNIQWDWWRIAYEFSQYHATEMSAKGDVVSYGQHKVHNRHNGADVLHHGLSSMDHVGRSTSNTVRMGKKLTKQSITQIRWATSVPVIFSWLRISVRLHKLCCADFSALWVSIILHVRGDWGRGDSFNLVPCCSRRAEKVGSSCFVATNLVLPIATRVYHRETQTREKL